MSQDQDSVGFGAYAPAPSPAASDGPATPLSGADLVAMWHAHSSRGPEAAHELAHKIIQNDDGSWTIARQDIILLVRMCSALGKPGPPLVHLMRTYRQSQGVAGPSNDTGEGACASAQNPTKPNPTNPKGDA